MGSSPVAVNQKIWILPLDSDLKRQTDIVGRKYQGSNKVYEFDKKEGDETINKEEKYDDKKPTIKKYE